MVVSVHWCLIKKTDQDTYRLESVTEVPTLLENRISSEADRDIQKVGQKNGKLHNKML